MLGFLKTIFRGRTATPQGKVGLAIPRTVYTPPSRSAAPPACKSPRTSRSANPPSPAASEEIPEAPASVPSGTLGSDIDISLQSVLNGLPPDLKERVRDLDIRGATMTISLERILAQLPSGSVKISFGSLRHAAPQLFSAGADCDSKDVALPLDEILAKVNPAMICPPQEQSLQRLDEQSGTVFPDAPTTTAQAEVETPQRASTLSVPPIAVPGDTAAPSASEVTGPEPSRIEAPGPPRSSGAALRPTSFPAAPSRKVNPKSRKKGPGREPKSPAAQVAQPGPSISVNLASLTGNWPEELRQEIAKWNLPEAKIALPIDTVREGMKRGRVAFPWQTLRSWISPEPPPEVSVQNNATLDLPLSVLTPLFFADEKQSTKPAGRATAEQQPTREEIPDLFFDARKTGQSNGENSHETVTPDAPPQEANELSVMRIPLKELTQLWPENLRAEVAHWNLDQLMVALPAERINAALRQGKVVFAWENLRSWILPAPPASTALQDRALLELPLPVIMPLFLAAQKQSPKLVAKSAPQIADDIPDPFADFLPSNSSAPAAAVAPAVAREASETEFRRKPEATPASPQKSPGTKFVKRDQTAVSESASLDLEPSAIAPQPEATPTAYSTPAEVLAAATTLDGVAGALVALPDGFKVASKLPPGVDGDTVAAFLPHIFSKVNQSTRELRMGELSNLNFTVDNVPWKIFRVNQIFFAALGQAGRPMPTDQLSALAHKLTFKTS